MKALSSLLQRSGLANVLGMSFGGKRSLYDVFGYSKVLRFDDLLAKYHRQDIAARLLEAPSAAIWSNPPTVTATDESWNIAWNNLIQRHNLFFVLNRLDNLAGLGRYSVLFVGFTGEGLKANYEKPISRGSSTTPREVLYFQPYSEPAAHIVKVVGERSDPRFLMPELYDLKPFINQPAVPGQPTIAQASFRVHASRCLHIAEGALEDTLIGRPRLERLSNRLDDMEKISGGTAETYWLSGNRGMQANIDKEMDLTPDDEKALTDELEEYQHQLRRWIRTRGVEIKSLGENSPDPRGAFDVTLALLAGASGLPQRVMTGAEAGQLASAQDRANWAERIEERRKLFAEPIILWPLIKMLTEAGVLPQPENLKITIDWPTAFRLSPLEESSARAQQARSAVNLSRALTDNQTRAKNANTKQVIPGTQQPIDPGATGSEPGSIEGTPASKNAKNKPKTKAQAFPVPAPMTGETQDPSQAEKDLGDVFITIPEARHFIGLEKATPTFDQAGDVGKDKGAK